MVKWIGRVFAPNEGRLTNGFPDRNRLAFLTAKVSITFAATKPPKRRD
jgi:hypothetical protein